MWVTKNGQTQVIDDETLPYWRSQGWVEWQPDAGAEATVAPAWTAATAYVAGQMVWQAGQLYRAKADFTSGGSFSAGNWDAVGSAAYTPFSTAIGNGTNVSYTVTHNLGRTAVQVTVRETSSGAVVYPTVVIVDANSITVTFATAPASNFYTVVVG